MTDQLHTKWPLAAPLQRAADTLTAWAEKGLDEDYAPQIDAETVAQIAEWMHATADALAWLAPFHGHEPGYRMWTTAEKAARLITGEDDPAPCLAIHGRKQCVLPAGHDPLAKDMAHQFRYPR